MRPVKFLLVVALIAHAVLSTVINTCSPFGDSDWQCPPFPLLEATNLNYIFARCLSVVQNDPFVGRICNRHTYTSLVNAVARDACGMFQNIDSLADSHTVGFSTNFTEFIPSADTLKNMPILVQLLQLGIATLNQTAVSDNGERAKSVSATAQELVAEATACYGSISAYNREMFSTSVTKNSQRQLLSDPINLKSARFMSAQLEYLLYKAERHELYVWPGSERAELRSHEALIEYFQGLKKTTDVFLDVHMEPAFRDTPDFSMLIGSSDALTQLIPYHYNRLVYMRPFPTVSSGFRVLNPLPTVFLPRGAHVDNFDARGTVSNIEKLYREQHVVVLDNFLDRMVIEELYKWALESSIWHVTEKHRYVGSYWNDGFAHPYLLRVAREVQAAYPFLSNHSLMQMWAYNYHFEETGGITLHADAAIVNVNLWITVDDANLDPETGGLVVYTKPLTGEETFQQVQDPAFGYSYLADTRDQNYTIPYRQNRATIFNSNLYHETDKLNFKREFSKRRINFTFLFGEGKYAASA